ncbi:inorganic diphosphatase [Sporolactobacillus spathodeae]|uniref:inorganic diphosphatase n=1 Tax=Sporolactobacillus spathodeae TaxID=1465502 RepID=A0ABS2Q9K9_9BACL|nr:inorganic diphosphatase [Sporolactobacillus spathodeae]MBM7658450.1 inorganic pyrophosphatase [Sporolactobacillus spathodeae]
MDYLSQTVKVIIDRPMCSRHPEHENLYYPINYGYVPHTLSPDGEETDAYVIGEFVPLKEYTGVVVAIIHRTNDDDDKLVVTNKINRYSKEQIMALVEFQERFFDSKIITE